MNYKSMWNHLKTLLSENNQDFALGVMKGFELSEEAIVNTKELQLPDFGNKTHKPQAQQRKLTYNHIDDEVYIDASESELDPGYLKHLLDYLDIPQSARRIFTRDSTKS